jgi:signal transduction histidine kinase
VCVPLAVEQQPLGVILADNKYSLSPIRPQQVQLLEIFSRQASLAIARARAYDQIRSHLEELQATRDRLIEAERMASVGRMASHLAHEIRNPLTAIGGFARALARQFEGDAGTHRKAMVIYEEARRLERTLANVLDYTRPLRPKKVPISVNDIVLETMEQFKSEVEEGNIAVNLSLAERMHPVLADPAMIKQVVINLVKNAIGAMEQNAERRLSVTTSQEADEVTIVVADNGCGMEQGTMENLFSPFFTTKVGGIGLGLSISQRIVRQHGGAIKSESDVGTGSTFTVTLPVQNTDEGVKGDGPRLQGTQKEEGG